MIGKTLDDKYSIERELGRGGMGTVYLAMHLGTERPVAIKVISPQYMQRPEFVERFRREARAAGRLRHPNVVDVTDFGFAQTDEGQVAYLVMEYLDGCTLGEILEEEKNLPVAWSIDILEQVCSAVHEAHTQGIIHRDLKPDNIWLEPNQRGGYTVKVLDFGIAKLETVTPGEGGNPAFPTLVGGAQTNVDGMGDGTIHDSISPTLVGGSGTIGGFSEARTAVINVRPEPDTNASESATAIMATGVETDQDSTGTKLISDSGEKSVSTSFDSMPTKDLTRVGAVLGTPLYMSPEQCRGHRLDARSDIYSLGVIGYQMLAGSTPFSGDFTEIMESHKLSPPPPFNAKKVRKKLRRAILSALEKDPESRPQTAEAFATILRSRSEGIFGLLRRAGMIYTEHITKFLALSTLFFIPMIFLTGVILALSIMRATDQLGEGVTMPLLVGGQVLLGVATAFCTYLIIGTTTWIVTQSLAIPLRPIRLRAALKETDRKWKRFAGTGVLATLTQLSVGAIACAALAGFLILLTLLIFGVNGTAIAVAAVIGVALGFVMFLLTSVLFALVGPVVMMENLKGWAAIKRSAQLVRRSLVTSIAAVFIMFMIPAIVAGTISGVVHLTVWAIADRAQQAEVTREGDKTNIQITTGEGEQEVGVSVGSNRGVRIMNMDAETQKRLRTVISESLLQVLLLPIQILMTSFTAIIVALLYLKTRQAGGESLGDLLANFEQADQPRKKWQERVRQRLIQSGRVTSKPTG